MIGGQFRSEGCRKMFAFMKTVPARGVACVLGGFILCLSFASDFSYPNINTYLISYMRSTGWVKLLWRFIQSQLGGPDCLGPAPKDNKVWTRICFPMSSGTTPAWPTRTSYSSVQPKRSCKVLLCHLLEPWRAKLELGHLLPLGLQYTGEVCEKGFPLSY